MVQIAFAVLVFGALISAIYGQKTAQSFVRLCVGLFFAFVAAIAFFLYKLDQVGGHNPYPGEAIPQAAPVATIPSTTATASPQRFVTCPTCQGTGKMVCAICHGTGSAPQPAWSDPTQPPPAAQIGFCPSCNGTGFTGTCPTCGGKGGIPQ